MSTEILVKTQAASMKKVLASNSVATGTSITNPAASRFAPSVANGAIDMAINAEYSSNGLILIPFGTDTATETFIMTVFAWEAVHPIVAQNAAMWFAYPLASFTCTLCAITGLAGGEMDNTNFFCGTIALTFGNANVSNEVLSPTGDLVASIKLDGVGSRVIQPVFARNGSSVSCNALYRKV